MAVRSRDDPFAAEGSEIIGPWDASTSSTAWMIDFSVAFQVAGTRTARGPWTGDALAGLAILPFRKPLVYR